MRHSTTTTKYIGKVFCFRAAPRPSGHGSRAGSRESEAEVPASQLAGRASGSESKRSFQNKKGFTLVETLVAMGIGLLTAGMLAAVVTHGMRGLQAAKRLERLHANAMFMTDSLSYVVKQARMLDVPNPQALTVLLPDGTTRAYGLSAGRFTLDSVALTGEDVEINGLAFTEFPRSVRVAFSLTPRSGGESISATTTFAARNPF